MPFCGTNIMDVPFTPEYDIIKACCFHLVMIDVREAVPEDGEAIRGVHLSSITELGGQSYDQDQVEAWAHDRDPDEYPIESRKTYFLVAEQDGEILGFGYMKPEADEYLESAVDGEVTAIYVHPSTCRQGVGTQLYTELEAEARRQGIKSLGLWASLNAVPFYEAHGYQRVTDHVHELHDGIEVTVVEMLKSISR